LNAARRETLQRVSEGGTVEGRGMEKMEKKEKFAIPQGTWTGIKREVKQILSKKRDRLLYAQEQTEEIPFTPDRRRKNRGKLKTSQCGDSKKLTARGRGRGKASRSLGSWGGAKKG